MTAPSATGTVMGTHETPTCDVTRSRGSWLADGYRAGMGARGVEQGQIVLFPRPWYWRAWRWLRRMGRRPDGEWTVVEVTSTVLTLRAP